MVEIADFLIKFAIGPFEVNEKTGPLLVDKIWFRHFRPMELFLAREFVRKAILPGLYYFDVYLPTEETWEWFERMPEQYWRMAIPYVHRIDAVCYTDEFVYIIEFKVRLKYSAIGQLEGYADWFNRTYRPRKPIKKMVVYALDRPELHETCDRLNIIRYHMKV